MNGTMDEASALQRNYKEVLDRIAAACRAADRPPGSVSLLAVSKTFGADRVAALAAAGQRSFGENYVQEAVAKITALRNERPDLRLEWHFIGPIQSNKTRLIAEHFDWVQSIDRERIAERLSEQRAADRPPLQVCVQVNVSGEASKSGCAPADVIALARRIVSLPRLVLRGVMAIPEPSEDVAIQRGQAARVRGVFDDLRAAGLAVDTISNGMSADIESAIAEGSTMVRVGTALFGRRARVDD